MSENKVLLEVQNLKKYFPVKGVKGPGVQAVENVSFFINKGETLGLVGESGCGKTTTGRTILRLHEPTSGKIIYDGETIFEGQDPFEKKMVTVTDKNGKTVEKEQMTRIRVPKPKAVDMLPYRRKMQIIFQDPSASLDPRMTVGEIISEAIDIHKLAGSARALAVRPEFIVCDEPISAQDVSIQSQVVNMLEDMQNEMGLTYLFIAHDLSVVRHISNRIGVMYLGNMVELAESYELNKHPIHPYTKTLLSAVPIPDPEVSKTRQRIILEGDIPSPMNPPSGCRFHTRCPYATDRCRQEVPAFKEYGPGHYAACHLLEK